MATGGIRGLTGNALIILITTASSCGFLLFGYDNGVFSGIIVNPWFLKTFHHPNSKLLGTISALYNVGGFLGSVIAFFFGSKLGRRRAILLGISITTVGAIIQSATANLAELVVGRVVCGMGVGIMTSTVGLWQAETAPARTRGRYLTLQLLGGAVMGLFFAQWINYGFHNNTGRVAFAFPVAFQLVFIITAGSLIMFLPESPRWLVKQGRNEEAVEILARLQGPEIATELLADIISAEQLEKRTNQGTFRSLTTGGPGQNLRRLCLACGVMIMHQLNGINSITYYVPTLLQTFIKVDHATALWVSGMTSITSICCAIVPVLFIDRVGRIPFLGYGAAGQALMFMLISILLGLAPTHGEHTYGVAAVVMVFIFYGYNAATWLGPSWAYPAEILPLEIREKGLALGNICYWLFQFLIVEITPIALTNIGYKFYVILAVLNVFSTVTIFCFYPETKGLSLEGIDFYFARKYGGVTEADLQELDQKITQQIKEDVALPIEDIAVANKGVQK